MAGLALIQSLAADGLFSEKYALGPQFARGAFSTIHSAKSLTDGEQVAVKVVPLEEDDEIQEVGREVQFFLDTTHDNLVGYRGSWIQDQRVYMVLESCEIGSLASIYNDTDMGFDEDFIAYMCHECLQGLKYLHNMGIVHRDFKCANILMTKKGDIRIADFGTHGKVDNGNKRYSLVGTPHWMSPEVCANNSEPTPYATSADIWSLGITCIEAAEIDPPLGEVEPLEVIDLIPLTEEPPSFLDIEPWSAEFLDFVEEALNPDPGARPDAEELLEHLFLDEVNMKSGKRVAADILMFRESVAEMLGGGEAGYPGYNSGPVSVPSSAPAPTPAPEPTPAPIQTPEPEPVPVSDPSPPETVVRAPSTPLAFSKPRKPRSGSISGLSSHRSSHKTGKKHRSKGDGASKKLTLSTPIEMSGQNEPIAMSPLPGKERINRLSLNLTTVTPAEKSAPLSRNGRLGSHTRSLSTSEEMISPRARVRPLSSSGTKDSAKRRKSGGTATRARKGTISGTTPTAGKPVSFDFFTIHLPYGKKKTVFYVPENPLKPIIEKICDLRDLEMSDYELVDPVDLDPVDMNCKLGDIDDKQVLFRPIQRRRAVRRGTSTAPTPGNITNRGMVTSRGHGRANPGSAGAVAKMLALAANKAKYRQIAIEVAAMVTKKDIAEFQKLSSKQSKTEEKKIRPLKLELSELEAELKAVRTKQRQGFVADLAMLSQKFDNMVERLELHHKTKLDELKSEQVTEISDFVEGSRNLRDVDNSSSQRFDTFLVAAKKKGKMGSNHLEERFILKLETLRELSKIKVEKEKKLGEMWLDQLSARFELRDEHLRLLEEKKVAVKKAQVLVLEEFGHERQLLKLEQLKRSLQERQKAKRAEFMQLEVTMKEKRDAKILEAKEESGDRKELKATLAQINERFKREERDRKVWFEKHLKSSSEKDMEGLKHYQKEEDEIRKENLDMMPSQELAHLQEYRAGLKMDYLKAQHDLREKTRLELVRLECNLKLTENEYEFERDTEVAFSRYERQKKTSVLQIAKYEARLVELKEEPETADSIAEEKKVSKKLKSAKKDLLKFGEKYEAAKQEAFSEKEVFEAELKYIEYPEVNSAATIAQYKLGQHHELDTSEDEAQRIPALLAADKAQKLEREATKLKLAASGKSTHKGRARSGSKSARKHGRVTKKHRGKRRGSRSGPEEQRVATDALRKLKVSGPEKHSESEVEAGVGEETKKEATIIEVEEEPEVEEVDEELNPENEDAVVEEEESEHKEGVAAVDGDSDGESAESMGEGEKDEEEEEEEEAETTTEAVLAISEEVVVVEESSD
eukprot:TRINITY_DN3505_c0_g1_i1.p1 TRINITY_DN3505_c0_g1~~TRINITY_DN3505_c0_g1_i1.p1  ORF type:complete len:1321 (+),score=378.33 TRINITY_DN3505_c0_g1_i1:29-3964(+)